MWLAPPSPRSVRSLRVFLIIAAIVVLAAGAAAGYLWYSMQKPFGHIPPPGVFVEIPRGASQRTAARILAKDGVIRSAIAFELYARRHPKRPVQAGEYFFDHPLAGKEVFWKLAKGDVFEQPFTVKEGDTIFDIAHNLEAAHYMKAADFLNAARDASHIQEFAPGAKSLEGFLFPATYNLPHHPAPADLTAMMVRKFREAVQQGAPAPLDPQTPGTPLLSVVTLASLVESETPKPE